MALGLEPRCSQARLDMAKENDWILDSSILLPGTCKGVRQPRVWQGPYMSDVGSWVSVPDN